MLDGPANSRGRSTQRRLAEAASLLNATGSSTGIELVTRSTCLASARRKVLSEITIETLAASGIVTLCWRCIDRALSEKEFDFLLVARLPAEASFDLEPTRAALAAAVLRIDDCQT